VGDVGGDRKDSTRGLVAQNMVAGHNHGTDTAIVPEVDVGSVGTPVISPIRNNPTESLGK
jgi:hypothetical protein